MFINLFPGDCLEQMSKFKDSSIDMVLTDPPYGTTACKWDSVIPFEPMWEQLKRIVKPNGAIVLTASQPFTTALICSNPKDFRYCWVWKKSRPTLFQHANRRPMKGFEDVLVFGKCKTYNPQGLIEVDRKVSRTCGGKVLGDNWYSKNTYKQTKTGYPNGIIDIPNEGNTQHPTQKPVALMEYLIRTYTNENDVVLDFTMGSGTTGVAAVNTGRNFVGIELDTKYYSIAKDRIQKAKDLR